MDFQSITSLTYAQLIELQSLVRERAGDVAKPGGRPACLGLFSSVAVVVALLRTNMTQNQIAGFFGVSQSTVSRRWDLIRPVLAPALRSFAPLPREVVGSGNVLVDGTFAPVPNWRDVTGMYSGKRKCTCFNLQIAASPSGAVAAVGEPVPGSRHDAQAFHESGLADQLEGMVKCGDKGYQGHVEFSPQKRRPKQEKLDPDSARNNAAINSMRAAVERAIAHLKGWRMLATPFRASLHKFRDAYMAIVALYFFKWLDFPPSE